MLQKNMERVLVGAVKQRRHIPHNRNDTQDKSDEHNDRHRDLEDLRHQFQPVRKRMIMF